MCRAKKPPKNTKKKKEKIKEKYIYISLYLPLSSSAAVPPKLLLLAPICCLLNNGMTGNICLYRSQDQAFKIFLAQFLFFFSTPSPWKKKKKK